MRGWRCGGTASPKPVVDGVDCAPAVPVTARPGLAQRLGLARHVAGRLRRLVPAPTWEDDRAAGVKRQRSPQPRGPGRRRERAPWGRAAAALQPWWIIYKRIREQRQSKRTGHAEE
ncbi:hypothetical protein GCM10010429_50350 [Micromonospora olivasterospora]